MVLWCFAFLVTAYAQCVTKQIVKAGDGVTFPKKGDTVTMQYTGTLTSGQKFDSSQDHGKPFTTQIGVGKVIKGWDEGVPQMSLGERAILRVSAACAYGASGIPPIIPPNSDLIFTVKLLAINGKGTTTTVTAAGSSSATPSTSGSTSNAATASSSSATPVSSSATTTTKSSSPVSSTPPVTTTSTPATPPPASTRGLPVMTGNNIRFSGFGSVSVSSGSPQAPNFAGTVQSVFQPHSLPFQPSSHFFSLSSQSSTASVSSQPARPQLPSCRPDDCGHAISWDSQGMGPPVCLCNPICQEMSSTPGVLPCCPGTQQMCLDPYRSPSPHPPQSNGGSN